MRCVFINLARQKNCKTNITLMKIIASAMIILFVGEIGTSLNDLLVNKFYNEKGNRIG